MGSWFGSVGNKTPVPIFVTVAGAGVNQQDSPQETLVSQILMTLGCREFPREACDDPNTITREIAEGAKAKSRQRKVREAFVINSPTKECPTR
jgi:hypothetical protein